MERFFEKKITRRDALKGALALFTVGAAAKVEARQVPMQEEEFEPPFEADDDHAYAVHFFVVDVYNTFTKTPEGKKFIALFPEPEFQTLACTETALFLTEQTNIGEAARMSSAQALKYVLANTKHKNDLGNKLFEVLDIRKPEKDTEEHKRIHGERVAAVIDLLNFLFAAQLQIEHE